MVHASRPSTEVSRSTLITAAAALVALAASACGAAAQPGNFPTKAELDRLAAAPPPLHVFERGAVDVEKWEPVGPFPDAVDSTSTDDASPWTKTLLGVVAAKPGRVETTRGMACLGREVAAFAAEKKALPASPLMRFLGARCGVPSTSVGMQLISGDAPESTSDADVYAGWEAKVVAALPAALATGPRLAGIGFARKGKHAAVALVFAQRTVRLDNVPLVPADGKVLLRGELLAPAATVRALVTRGRFGYEECVKDVDLQPPRFAIECPVSAEDPTARIEVAAFQEGRELGDIELDLTVYPAGKPDQPYAHAPAKPDALPSGDAALAAALLGGINAARAEAGLAGVRAAEAQSRTAAQLAPYYFGSLHGGDAAVADKVALGMLAGWDVDGMVREGHFGSQWAYERDVAALVESAIASPFGREALLDREAVQIAIGPLVDKDNPGFGAVFGTYSMIDVTGKTDSAAAVTARLTKLRGKIKRPPPALVTELDPVLSDVTTRVQAGLSLEDALQRATSASLGAIARGSVRVWAVTASSVDKLEFPSELLSTPDLRLGVGVAHYKPAGSPWTKLAVFFVIVKEPAPANTASGSAKHSG